MAQANENDRRWKTKPDEFAVRVDLPDAPGLLKSSIVVEAGTRALVIDDGQYQGEIPPGEHTMESFIEKLKFWKRKQATIVLTRLEDQILDIHVLQVPTSENLLVNISTRLAVKIDDVEDFFNNMMGAERAISKAQLESFISPILRQAVWEAVRGQSIEDLAGATASQAVTDGIRQSLKLRLLRYGINFVDIQLVSIQHEKYNDKLEKDGEIWLKREGVEQQARIDEVYSENELRKIKNHERQNELRILAKKVDLEHYDQKTGVTGDKVEAMARRIDVRNNLREAMLSDRMNSVNSKEDLAKFIADVDKDKLLRQEEKDVMLEEFEQRQENRGEARDHLLGLLALNREQEIDVLRADIDHAEEIKSLNHSVELAELNDTERNREWRSKVDHERQQALERRDTKLAKNAEQWELLREHHREKQDDSWNQKLHEQRITDLEGDIDLSRTERENQVALLDDDLKTKLAESKLNRERYSEEQATDLNLDKLARTTDLQLDKLARLNELNFSHNEQEQRLASEMAMLREDKTHQRSMDRIGAMKGMTSDELLATAGAENAAILAGVKNNEALTDERKAMNEQFLAQEREKTEAVAAALKDAMATQQNVLNAVVGNTPAPATAPPPPQATTRDWHVTVNGEQHGPYTFSELQGQVSQGQLTRETSVWKQGLDGWKLASQVSELSGLFGSSPPTSPPPTPPPPPPVA
jgi:hypothetical protein